MVKKKINKMCMLVCCHDVGSKSRLPIVYLLLWIFLLVTHNFKIKPMADIRSRKINIIKWQFVWFLSALGKHLVHCKDSASTWQNIVELFIYINTCFLIIFCRCFMDFTSTSQKPPWWGCPGGLNFFSVFSNKLHSLVWHFSK